MGSFWTDTLCVMGRRAHLITDQIESLKRVLELSNFPLKSSSKYHVLAGCDEYIKQLKQKKKSLDLEAKLRSVSPVHVPTFPSHWMKGGDKRGLISLACDAGVLAAAPRRPRGRRR